MATILPQPLGIAGACYNSQQPLFFLVATWVESMFTAHYSFENPLWEHLHINLQEIFMKSGRVIFRHILCKNSLALGSFCSLAGALVLVKSAVCIRMVRALLLWSWEVLPASRNVSVCLSHGSQGLGGKVSMHKDICLWFRFN